MTFPASKRILICDDHDLFRGALRALLTRSGYAVTEADDGQTAVFMLHEAEDPCRTWDVVIMDYHMRFGLSGGEAVNRMRALCPDQPVIYLSGAELPEDLRRHEVCLMKPIEEDELVEAIERLIRSRAETIPPGEPDLPTNPLNPKPDSKE